MAKAELIKEVKPQPYLTLTLTKDEAQLLINLTGNVAGNEAYEIYTALTRTAKLTYQSKYEISASK